MHAAFGDHMVQVFWAEGELSKKFLLNLAAERKVLLDGLAELFLAPAVPLENIGKTFIQTDNLIMVDPFVSIKNDLLFRVVTV